MDGSEIVDDGRELAALSVGQGAIDLYLEGIQGKAVGRAEHEGVVQFGFAQDERGGT